MATPLITSGGNKNEQAHRTLPLRAIKSTSGAIILGGYGRYRVLTI
jgi:hypothetical protein